MIKQGSSMSILSVSENSDGVTISAAGIPLSVSSSMSLMEEVRKNILRLMLIR